LGGNGKGPVLSVSGLEKKFGKVHALKGIDMVLEGPGVYGFLGPNGAGKTTTFKIVSGLLRPDAGRVLIKGIDVSGDTPAAMRNLGILFDSPAYYPFLTGRENLEVFATWSGSGSNGYIDDLLDLVGLSGDGRRKVEGYSWGMKRRLGLASVLLSDPDLILMDEPTNGLDPSGIAHVRKLLPELAYRRGKTVLLSSHRMDEVDQVCDIVTIIHKGSIVASGKPSDLSGTEPVIEIVCSDPEKAVEILSATRGIEKARRIGGDRLSVLSPGLPAAAINALLVQAGVQVRQVMEQRESLEEVFFRLTGGEGYE
jgi:ABC-type multidrug transport system ATPase subunit